MHHKYIAYVRGWSQPRTITVWEKKIYFQVTLRCSNCSVCLDHVRHVEESLKSKNISFRWHDEYYSGKHIVVDEPDNDMYAHEYLSDILGFEIKR
jgi:hypothetical protein